MHLFSCLFGNKWRQHVESLASPEPNYRPVQLPAGVTPPSMEGVLCMAPAVETARPDIETTSARAKRSNLSALPDKSNDLCGSPAPTANLSSAAVQLLDGLAFSTRVLGTGSYGIVVQGSFNGVDVAVKFMVSNRRTDRAAVQEMTLGAMPGLTHPHICKSYDTRCVVLTNGLFDELEAQHQRQRRRLERQRQRQLLQQQQQQQPGVAAMAVLMGVSPGNGRSSSSRRQQSWNEADRRRRSSSATRGERVDLPRLRNQYGERVLQFFAVADGDDPQNPAYHMRSLESSAQLAVLHEVLFRLGGTVGQSVTLVVMELCGKGTLSRAIHRGIFAPCELWSARVAQRALLRTATEIARALLHLHKSGVVHGDLKPGNVLLKSAREDRRGFVAKIGDFGLSHLLPAGQKSLDTDTWGTPSYMAPEALLGHASTASDVWSFGVMLSEALTRRLPYGGSLEPALMVAGILDGSLELAWPAIHSNVLDSGPVHALSCCCGGAGGGDGATAPLNAAARLARQYGLVFPTTTLPSIASSSGGGGGGGANVAVVAVGSLMGTSGSTEHGTANGTTASTVTTAAATAMLGTMTGTDDMGGSADLGGGSAAAAGPTVDDVDCVLGCLVILGRRCTSRDPAERPCFAEILGELIDLEIVLKSSKQHRVCGGGMGKEPTHEAVVQDMRARARSRLASGGRAGAATGTAAAPTAGLSCSQAANVAAEDAAAATVAGSGGGGNGGNAVRAAAAIPRRPRRDLLKDFLQLVESNKAESAAMQQARAAAVLPPSPPPRPDANVPTAAAATPMTASAAADQGQDQGADRRPAEVEAEADFTLPVLVINNGPGPGTPEVSEGCHAASKTSLERLP